MARHDGYFDSNVAHLYDVRHTISPAEVKHIVDVLKDLSAGGTALEFAIGTGRIALPLAATGIPISGIELSQAMVDALRKKIGGDAIPVAVGDMTSTRVSGTFDLVFLVYNTIDNLTTQDAQVACFQNAADHLAPGGRFLIETLVPPVRHLPPGEPRLAFDLSETHWGVDTFDLAAQSYTSHHLWITDNGTETFSSPFRYAWPAELDLMARLAGLTLESRWGDWDRSPFTGDSRKHVSVWRKA